MANKSSKTTSTNTTLLQNTELNGAPLHNGLNKVPASSSAPSEKGLSLEEITERMLAIDGSNEDVASLIARNWSKIIWVLVVCAIGIVVVFEFQATRNKKSKELAQRFSDIQADLTKVLEDEKAFVPSPALLENLKLFASNNANDTYGSFAKLYQAIIATNQKQYDEAESVLSGLPISSLLISSEVRTLAETKNNDLFLELAALQSLRISLVRLENGNEPKKEEVTNELRKKFINLAASSQYITLEAVLGAVRLASSDAEKRETKDFIGKLIAKRDKLSVAISKELEKEGLTL